MISIVLSSTLAMVPLILYLSCSIRSIDPYSPSVSFSDEIAKDPTLKPRNHGSIRSGSSPFIMRRMFLTMSSGL